MKPLVAALVALAALAPNAFADGWAFSQTQGMADDQFHISIGGGYSEQGQPPRNNNFGVGTIKVSLPHTSAQYDPVTPTDVPGYNCLRTTSAYGEPDTGFLCSNDGTPQGAGTAFPTAVTMHLISAECYTPPAQGEAQPALVEVWAAPFDPGTAPDVSFPLYNSSGCTDNGPQQPVIEDKPLTCTVPNVKFRTLSAAIGRITHNRCKLGNVKRVYSKSLAKGKVISQSLKAGKVVKTGTRVSLIVSKGPKKKRG